MTWAVPTVDPEFSRLIPPLAPEERRCLERSLVAEGCREPLLVWQEQNLLLDGHNRLELCLAHNIVFRCQFVSLPDRAAARACIVARQLERRNLTREAAAYLRGRRYQAEKRSLGGNRRASGAVDHFDPLNTAERLAAEYKVGEATIKRDEQFATAVDAIVSHCGEEARNLLLSRDSGLTQGQVLALAKRAPAEQKEVLQALAEKGKPPRRKQGRPRTSITLPREPQALVARLIERLGQAGAAEVFRLLAQCPEVAGQPQAEAASAEAGPPTTMVGPEAKGEPLVLPTPAGSPQQGGAAVA